MAQGSLNMQRTELPTGFDHRPERAERAAIDAERRKARKGSRRTAQRHRAARMVALDEMERRREVA